MKKFIQKNKRKAYELLAFALVKVSIISIPLFLSKHGEEKDYIFYETSLASIAQLGMFFLLGALSILPRFILKENKKEHDIRNYIYLISILVIAISAIIYNISNDLAIILMLVVVYINTSNWSLYFKTNSKVVYSLIFDLLFYVILFSAIYTSLLLLISIILIGLLSLFKYDSGRSLLNLKNIIIENLGIFIFVFISQLVPQYIRLFGENFYSQDLYYMILYSVRIFTLGVVVHQLMSLLFFKKILQGERSLLILIIPLLSVAASLFLVLFMYIFDINFIEFNKLNTYYSIVSLVYLYVWVLMSLLELRINFIGVHKIILKSFIYWLIILLPGLIVMIKADYLLEGSIGAMILMCLIYNKNIIMYENTSRC